ncbi:hypothetical protein AS4_28590 [Acinetobacter guillouiae]|uniref:hypothetical protein n=1 Tax=Acinetobacter guillouiae TaxID=106649 RepID=UPI0004EF62D9|nr:hypothetical protein [Acinetobacter guillouiae]BAP37799.1 hypothetical protein AS4_28590 [Acinetobacter guillouiae]
MSNRVSTPFPVYNDTDGTSLDAGFIFIGGVNSNPINNPIAIFYDAELTMPAENPARTRNGYIVKNGAARQLFCAEPIISILVLNKRKETVWNSASVNLNPGVTTDAVIDTESGKSQAEINSNTLRISENLEDLNNKEQARSNLEVYSKTEVDDKTKQATEEIQGTAKVATEDIAKALSDDTTFITPKKMKAILDEYLFGRKWQDVTAERNTATKYKNDTKQYIDISIIMSGSNTDPTKIVSIDVIQPNSITTARATNAQQYSQEKTISTSVPPEAEYRVNGDKTGLIWLELRKPNVISA